MLMQLISSFLKMKAIRKNDSQIIRVNMVDWSQHKYVFFLIIARGSLRDYVDERNKKITAILSHINFLRMLGMQLHFVH